MKNVIKFFFGCALIMTMFSFTKAEVKSKRYSKQYIPCVTPSGQSGTTWSCVTFTGSYCPDSEQGQHSGKCIADGSSEN